MKGMTTRRGNARNVLLCAALFLTACSDSPKTTVTKEPEKPLEPITGRQAFQKIFPAARLWAIDAKPLQMESYDLSMVKAPRGKAAAWQVTFVSDSLRKSRSWTWSAAEAPGNLHLGVFAGLQQDWSGPTGQASPFEIAAIRVDSDAALETALKQKDTIEYERRYPGKPIKFLLERTRRFPDLSWRLIWGESISASDYSVFIDASSGGFLGKIR